MASRAGLAHLSFCGYLSRTSQDLAVAAREGTQGGQPASRERHSLLAVLGKQQCAPAAAARAQFVDTPLVSGMRAELGPAKAARVMQEMGGRLLTTQQVCLFGRGYAPLLETRRALLRLPAPLVPGLACPLERSSVPPALPPAQALPTLGRLLRRPCPTRPTSVVLPAPTYTRAYRPPLSSCAAVGDRGGAGAADGGARRGQRPGGAGVWGLDGAAARAVQGCG